MAYIGRKPTPSPLTSSDITDGIITTAKIVDANITTAKILDANITTSKIADDAVTTDKLANSINSAITANTAKVTNATHSGDVTGATALTIADNAVTLAKMASGTDGNIISYDASGNPVAVATGSAGQVLTSAGAGSPPTFAAISASGVSDSFQAVADGSGYSQTHSGNLIVNNEVHDDGNNYNTSTGRYTAPSTGYYLFMAGCLVSGSAGQNFYLTKQNSPITSAKSWGYNGTGNQNASNVYGIVYLTAGQYAGIYSTTAVYTNQFLYFGGCKLY